MKDNTSGDRREGQLVRRGPQGDGSARGRGWPRVLGVLKPGGLVFLAFCFSIALTVVISGDGGSLAEDLRLSGGLAAATAVLIGVVWALVSVYQWLLDLRVSRSTARALEASTPDKFMVDDSEGDAPRCDVGGGRLEYIRSHRQGTYTVQIRSEGRSLLTVTTSRDPRVLEARVMRAGLTGTVLDLPLRMSMSRRGLLRRHRHIDITAGDQTMRYMWGRSRPILVRGTSRQDVVAGAKSSDAYVLYRPVSEREEIVAITLALGAARPAIRSPIWGFLEALFDGI